jgi:hypothetical protein
MDEIASGRIASGPAERSEPDRSAARRRSSISGSTGMAQPEVQQAPAWRQR